VLIFHSSAEDELGRQASMEPSQRIACPCCAFLTLKDRGGFEMCPVCWWVDDGQDDADADVVRGGPNGTLSLTDARANFRQLGASDPGLVRSVRQPLPDEMP
jgi:hypothetical protein